MVLLTSIPKGERGTIGRIIYRTVNKQDGLVSSLDTYYEVARIMENVSTSFIDTVTDSQLMSSAQADETSSVVISPSYQYVAVWNNRVWLAGGQGHHNEIIYSETNRPEQFGLYNRLQCGSSGDYITALVPHNDTLYVFRKGCIDAINFIGGTYTIRTIDESVGTVATNTIKAVPGHGVFFLASDGVYSIGGGFSGGSVYKSQHVSNALDKEWKRLTTSALQRATAAYSSKEQEYWVHYPADSYLECSRGAVYHTVAKGWSLRNSDQPLYFSFLSLDTDKNFIMGTAHSPLPAIATARSSFPGMGIQVWTRTSKWGDKWTWSSTHPQDGWTYTITPNERGYSEFTSVEESVADFNTFQNFTSVILTGMSHGYNAVDMYYSTKEGRYGSTASVAVEPHDPATLNSLNSNTILGPVVGKKASSTWGSSYYYNSTKNTIKFSLSANDNKFFSWTIKTANSFSIIGYEMEFTVKGHQTITSGRN